MTVDPRLITQDCDIAQRQTLDLEVPASWANQDSSRQQHISGLCFLDSDGTHFIESPGEHLGETFGHMLDHGNGGGEIRGQLRENILQGLRSASRNADSNYFGRFFP